MEAARKCAVGNRRCLCADCIQNAAYEDCERGYCINCLECEDARRQVHDVYLCTGHEARPSAEAQEGNRDGKI